MERTEIASLYRETPADGTVLTVCGWAKNIRDSKNIGFIALSDGGCFKTLQVVFERWSLRPPSCPTMTRWPTLASTPACRSPAA